MFFSTYVLTKKGPLAKIWLAAHWDRRLTRNEVRVVDLRQSVVDIVQPAVPIALRTSGELLVGVVRIYALKVKHLLKDATDATLVLRVTTLTTKSASTPSGSISHHTNSKEHDNAVSASSASSKVLLDGVLLNGGGDIEAVTFDWSNGASANAAAAAGVVVGNGKTDAEALEARFDAIADLLQGGMGLSRNSITPIVGSNNNMNMNNMNMNNNGTSEKDASALLASAWYALEPSSQAVEELHTTQQDYDEIAKMRADLMAFGDRVSGSSSSKKSSIPSIEKARSSGLTGTTTTGAVLGDLAGFPLPAEELDIGVPLPDDPTMLPDFMMPSHGIEEDPLAVPDIMDEQQQQQQQEEQQQQKKIKTRPTNILDLAATTVSAETVQRWMDDRSDIVESIPRRGPYDTQEARDRIILTSESSKGELWAVVNAAPLAWMPNPALRTLYTSLLLPALEQAETSILPLHHQHSNNHNQHNQGEDPFQQIPAGGMEEEEEAFLQRGNKGENGELLDMYNTTLENRKRGLDENNNNNNDNDDENNNNGNQTSKGGLSAAAITTLKRIRDVLETPSQPVNKRSKKESAPRERCLLQEVCRGMHRREAARTFANVLALASKQLVMAQQPSSSGDVELGLLSAADTVLLKV